MIGKKWEPSFHDLNLHRLEEEWLAQVRLFAQYATELAEADYAVEVAKTDLKLTEAELEEADARLDREIRRHHIEFGIERITESAVEKTIILQGGHVRAKDKMFVAMKKLNELKRDRDIAKVAVDTMHQRNPALKDLVTLQGRSYYSTPNLPHTVGGEELQERIAEKAFKKERNLTGEDGESQRRKSK